MGPFLVHGLRAVFLGVPFRDDCLKCCVYFTFLFVVYVSHCYLKFLYQFLYIVLGFHSGEKIFPIPISFVKNEISVREFVNSDTFVIRDLTKSSNSSVFVQSIS